jgi:hypothetical protein
VHLQVWAEVDMVVTPPTPISAPPIDPSVLEHGESNTPLSVELLKVSLRLQLQEIDLDPYVN